MNGNRFDVLTAQMTNASSRRDVMRALASLGMGVGAAWRIGGAGAKRKRKKKGKKAKSNAFGCLNVGKSCKSAEQCCAGICEGKKGGKRCGAHGAGTCNQAAEGACEAAFPTQTACNNNVNCRCLRTTAGSNFCADLGGQLSCADCRKDADCEALGLPAGSACLPFSTGFCAGNCESGMVCLPPCGVTPEAD